MSTKNLAIGVWLNWHTEIYIKRVAHFNRLQIHYKNTDEYKIYSRKDNTDNNTLILFAQRGVLLKNKRLLSPRFHIHIQNIEAWILNNVFYTQSFEHFHYSLVIGCYNKCVSVTVQNSLFWFYFVWPNHLAIATAAIAVAKAHWF